MSAPSAAVVFTADEGATVDYRFDGQALPRGSVPLAVLTAEGATVICDWYGLETAVGVAAQRASDECRAFGGPALAWRRT